MRYQRAAQPLKLDGPEAARSFFASCFAESDPARECLWVAHVDNEARCIHLTRHDGEVSEVGLPVRMIISDAAAHGSAGIILAHSHPSGDPRPSDADCFATRRLACAATGLGCAVLDHLVFAGASCTSFRELGLL
ncbi:MAG: JAB domain-containing protein [Sphingomonas sp.]|nr:JAB domain-containing protein [Sphingomonas sp.]